MARPLRVFGGVTFVGDQPRRTIVAATGMHVALAAVIAATEDPFSYSTFRNYWTRSNDSLELKLALGRPGVVFQAASSTNRYDLHPLETEKDACHE